MSAGGVFEPWPAPIHEKSCTDADGVEWRLQGARGDGLDERDLRRLIKKHGDIRVLHSYDRVAEVEGEARDELLARVREFWAGEAPPMRGFYLAEFRDDERRVILVVQEWC